MIAVKVREEMLPSGEISSCITGTGSGIEATSKGDSFFSTTGTWATRTSKKFKKTQNNYNKRSFQDRLVRDTNMKTWRTNVEWYLQELDLLLLMVPRMVISVLLQENHLKII